MNSVLELSDIYSNDRLVPSSTITKPRATRLLDKAKSFQLRIFLDYPCPINVFT
jgi:hypothetical protein